MPSLGGLDVLRQLGDLMGEVRAIVYTAAIRQEEVATALRAGARGIVLKDAATQILVSSIRAVMNGQYWLCRDVLTDLTQILGTSHPPNQANNFGLTPRQIEVVAHVVAGRSNKEIAARLAVSEETIKHHLTHIFERLRVSNRVELAVFAAGRGLVAPG
jgi:two-component system nitrate/nitrite response regulator NarL